MEKIFCAKCSHLIDISPIINCVEIYDYNQGDCIRVIVCKECKTKNSISWEASIDFNSDIATDKEILEQDEIWEEEILDSKK